MKARATGFVEQADAALADVERAEEIWQGFSTTRRDETRLHVLSIELDKAIREVEGSFSHWDSLDPAQVSAVLDTNCLYLIWTLSAHRSGYVREAFVRDADRFENVHVLPHLANRALDFVPAIRELATSIVVARLDAVIGERARPESQGILPTAAHIAVTKLLTPRTAVVSPELIEMCIALAETAPEIHRPASFKQQKLDRMLQRCQQTGHATSDPVATQALDALTRYFNKNAKS